MALHPSDEQRQGQTVESGAGCPAEEIAGAVYLRLETGAGVARLPAGRSSMNERRGSCIAICILGRTLQPKVEWFGKMLMLNPGLDGQKKFKLPRGVCFQAILTGVIMPANIFLEGRRQLVEACPPS